MAKGKKRSKLQKRALRRGKSAKARKVSKAARAKATKRTVAKPKRAPAKKAARKVKQPVGAAVETVIVDVVEEPVPGVITITEVEETAVRPGSE